MTLPDAKRERLIKAAVDCLTDAMNDAATHNRIKAAGVLLDTMTKLLGLQATGEGTLAVTVVYEQARLPLADGRPVAPVGQDARDRAWQTADVPPGETRELFGDRGRTDDWGRVCPGWSTDRYRER